MKTKHPAILRRDYFRHAIWPHLQIYGAMLILGAIVFGAIR